MVNEFETNSSAYTTVLERVAYMIKQNFKKILKKKIGKAEDNVNLK